MYECLAIVDVEGHVSLFCLPISAEEFIQANPLNILSVNQSKAGFSGIWRSSRLLENYGKKLFLLSSQH